MINVTELRIDQNNNLIIKANVLEIPTDPLLSFKFTKVIALFSSGIEMDLLNIQDINILSEDKRVINAAIPLLNDLDKNIIKVQFYVEGSTEAEVTTPCSYNKFFEGYAYKECLIAEHVLYNLDNTDCSDYIDLANAVAQAYALESAIKVRDWESIKKYWNTFFMNTSFTVNKHCNCHGL